MHVERRKQTNKQTRKAGKWEESYIQGRKQASQQASNLGRKEGSREGSKENLALPCQVKLLRCICFCCFGGGVVQDGPRTTAAQGGMLRIHSHIVDNVQHNKTRPGFGRFFFFYLPSLCSSQDPFLPFLSTMNKDGLMKQVPSALQRKYMIDETPLIKLLPPIAMHPLL